MNIDKEQIATVFNIEESKKRKNTYFANISTYEGKDLNGNVVYSSWRTQFVHNAYEKAAQLKDKDKIKLTNAKVENNYIKEKEKLYDTVTVFDFEMAPERKK